MSTVIKEECEVPAFKYFQNEPRSWITVFTTFDNSIPDTILLTLTQKKHNIKTSINELKNNRDDLKKGIKELNTLTKTYLKVDDNQFDIEISEEEIDEYIKLLDEKEEKIKELKSLPGGNLLAEKNKLQERINLLNNQLKDFTSHYNDNINSIKAKIMQIKKDKKNVIIQKRDLKKEINQINIMLLSLKAKKNLQDIKIKHHTKLLESYETTYREEEEKMKKDIEELEKKIENNNKEIEELSEEKIKERVKQEFKTKTISDATGSNDSTQEKETRKSVVVGNPYFDNSIINDKFPIPVKYEMTEDILYNGNDNFRNIGRLLLDKDKNAVTSKESKLFSMKEKGFDSVVTINMNNINNELEKYE